MSRPRCYTTTQRGGIVVSCTERPRELLAVDHARDHLRIRLDTPDEQGLPGLQSAGQGLQLRAELLADRFVAHGLLEKKTYMGGEAVAHERTYERPASITEKEAMSILRAKQCLALYAGKTHLSSDATSRWCFDQTWRPSCNFPWVVVNNPNAMLPQEETILPGRT